MLVKINSFLLITIILTLTSCTTPLPRYKLVPIEWCSREEVYPYRIKCENDKVYRYGDYKYDQGIPH